MKNYKLSRQVQDALDFLNNHPGVCHDSCFVNSNLTFWMVDVCKNNEYKDYFHNDKNPVEVYLPRDGRYKKDRENFKKFVEKYKDEDETVEECSQIYVPYKEIYGYDWEYDRTYYKGEYCFYKYYRDEQYIDYLKTTRKIDDSEAVKLASWLHTSYSGYQGGDVKADTYEEMIIKIAEDVKRKYGDFSCEDFLTEEEKENHENIDWMFKFEPCEDREGCSEMLRNPDYIRIEQYQYNQRWVEWFKTTDYYKKHWDGQL